MRLLLSIIFFGLSGAAFAQGADSMQTTKCKEHSHTLDIKSYGFEHVNHLPLLDHEVSIKELAEGSWFIESVRCTPSGFSIVASHRQYGDSNTQQFLLTPMSGGKYDVR